jgi:hypothetical protein
MRAAVLGASPAPLAERRAWLHGIEVRPDLLNDGRFKCRATVSFDCDERGWEQLDRMLRAGEQILVSLAEASEKAVR